MMSRKHVLFQPEGKRRASGNGQPDIFGDRACAVPRAPERWNRREGYGFSQTRRLPHRFGQRGAGQDKRNAMQEQGQD